MADWKTRDEQIIDSIARFEEKQNRMHQDIKEIKVNTGKINNRVTSLEHTKTYMLAISGFIVFLVSIAKCLGMV